MSYHPTSHYPAGGIAYDDLQLILRQPPDQYMHEPANYMYQPSAPRQPLEQIYSRPYTLPFSEEPLLQPAPDSAATQQSGYSDILKKLDAIEQQITTLQRDLEYAQTSFHTKCDRLEAKISKLQDGYLMSSHIS